MLTQVIALLLVLTATPALSFNSSVIAVKKIERAPGADVRVWDEIVSPRFVFARGARIVGEISDDRGYEANADVIVVTGNTIGRADISFAYAKTERDVSKTDNATTEVSVERSSVGFILAFGHIVEYNDDNGKEGLQEDDTINGWYNLGWLLREWRDINCTHNELAGQPDDLIGVAKTCIMSTADNVFAMRFTLAEDFANVENHVLTPDMVKVDVAIRWFNNPSLSCPLGAALLGNCKGPSTASEAPNAKIALTGGMLARAGTANWDATRKIDRADSTVSVEGQLSFEGDEDAALAVFTWESETSDGASVHSQQSDSVPDKYPASSWLNNRLDAFNSKDGQVGKFLVFSFDSTRPESIVWDPEFALDSSLSPSLTLSLLVTITSTLFIIL